VRVYKLYLLTYLLTTTMTRIIIITIIIIIIIVYFRHRVHINYNKTTQRIDRKHTEIYTKRPTKVTITIIQKMYNTHMGTH